MIISKLNVVELMIVDGLSLLVWKLFLYILIVESKIFGVDELRVIRVKFEIVLF